MVWRFNLADAKTVALHETQPGDVVLPLNTRVNGLWLRLAGVDGRWATLQLSGDQLWKVWDLNPQSASMRVLVVAKGAQCHLEVAEGTNGVSPTGQLGELRLSEKGSYVVAKIEGDGHMNECCVALADWSMVGLHESGDQPSSFKTWRLVEDISPTQRKVICSTGTWDERPS